MNLSPAKAKQYLERHSLQFCVLVVNGETVKDAYENLPERRNEYETLFKTAVERVGKMSAHCVITEITFLYLPFLIVFSYFKFHMDNVCLHVVPVFLFSSVEMWRKEGIEAKKEWWMRVQQDEPYLQYLLYTYWKILTKKVGRKFSYAD